MMKLNLIVALSFIMLILFFSGCSPDSTKSNTYTGSIEASQVNIEPDINGKIAELDVNLGDTVKKGDVIAKLDVRQFKEQENSAKAALDIANLKYNKMKNFNTAETDMAKLTLDQAQSQYNLAKLMVDRGTLLSSINGVITGVNINQGEMAMPGSEIVQISDLNNLYVKIYIPEKYLNRVSLNNNVQLKIDSLSEDIKGKIVFISSEGEFTPKNTGTKSSEGDIVYEVKIKVQDHLKDLKPGMLADVIY